VADDERRAISLIALVGSVFSPFYAAARARAGGRADPLDHCSMNVALYGPSRSSWSPTERGRAAITRREDHLAIGPSSIRWQGGALVVEFDEITAVSGERVAGRVRLFPGDAPGAPVALDAAGRHAWWPIAPVARAEVDLSRPSQRWSGAAYFDANGGHEPLEAAFTGWSWSRVGTGASTRVTYDVERRDGSRLVLVKAFDHERSVDMTASGRVDLGRTAWLLRRGAPACEGGPTELVRTLEDTPFYARSLVRSTIAGRRAIGTHEALSLDRFRSRVVQFMLPYRMRRAPT
jgi:carotenoid 1,2-hydratase